MATAKKEEKELVTTVSAVETEMPDYLKGMEEDTSGNEEVGRDDIVIPRLGIIQAISPELDKNDPAYIPGAETGKMFNTLTRELIDEILVISIRFEKPFLLWKDRKKGGGFGGQFFSMEEAEEAVAAKETPSEWDIVDTPTNLCLAIPKDDKPYEISIPLPRSKAKVSRNWNSLIRLAGGPRFGRVYKITTVPDKNANGEKYTNFKVEMAGFPSEPLFKAAKEIYENIIKGEVTYSTDYSDAGGAEGGKEDASF